MKMNYRTNKSHIVVMCNAFHNMLVLLFRREYWKLAGNIHCILLHFLNNSFSFDCLFIHIMIWKQAYIAHFYIAIPHTIYAEMTTNMHIHRITSTHIHRITSTHTTHTWKYILFKAFLYSVLSVHIKWVLKCQVLLCQTTWAEFTKTFDLRRVLTPSIYTAKY